MRSNALWASIGILWLAAAAAAPGGEGSPPSVSKTLSVTLAEAQGTNPAVVIELIGVPAGEFMMGTNPDGAPPRYDPKGEFYHRVRISRPFYLGKYELTLGQWGAVMGMKLRYAGKLDCPANAVSWQECTNFTAILNQRYASQLPPGMVFRLPTEAEWEYAARAGTATAYYFGNDPALLDEYAWHRGNATEPMPVGRKKPNAWGFHDITGNVWELCLDFFRPNATTTNAITIDPLNTVSNYARTVRGGSYIGQDGPESIRTSSQWGNIWPDKHRVNVGMRLAIGYPMAPWGE